MCRQTVCQYFLIAIFRYGRPNQDSAGFTLLAALLTRSCINVDVLSYYVKAKGAANRAVLATSSSNTPATQTRLLTPLALDGTSSDL